MSGSIGKSSTESSSSTYPWDVQAQFLQRLYSQASELMGAQLPELMGGAGFHEQLFQPAVGAYQSLLAPPGVNPMLEAYAGDVTRNLNENIMPSITRYAVGAGQSAGDPRAQLAAGVAGRDANEQVRDMAMRLYGEDRDRQLQAMGMGENLLGLGMGGFMAPWMPLLNLAQILGVSPAMMGESESEGWGFNIGM